MCGLVPKSRNGMGHFNIKTVLHVWISHYKDITATRPPFLYNGSSYFTINGLQWRHNERDGVSNHGISVVYWTVCSGADQRKHQSSASLAIVRGIHRWQVNSPHKGPVTRKMFAFDDVIMAFSYWNNPQCVTPLSLDGMINEPYLNWLCSIICSVVYKVNKKKCHLDDIIRT